MTSARTVDRLLSVAVYAILAMVLIAAGGRAVDYAGDVTFYNDFLLPWQTRLLALRSTAAIEPAAAESDPVGRMQAVVAGLRRAGLTPPHSNTGQPFMYRLGLFGRPTQPILLVADREHLSLFGLPAGTFNRLDGLIDGHIDPLAGAFTGRPGSDRQTWIAHWRY